MIMKNIGWHMEGVGDSLILTLTGDAGFLIQIGGTCFLILSEIKEEDIQILMSLFLLLFLLLTGVMMFSQPYFGSRKIICLTLSIYPWKIMSNL